MTEQRLLMFNLMTDTSNPVLGFTTAWIEALAQHYDAIDVITMYQGVVEVPQNVNVFSAGREQGLSKPKRVLRFYSHLIRLLATHTYDACFAHMMPLFAGLAGPLLSLKGIRTVLWYTHRQQSRQLKLGMHLSWRIVTAVETSFPYETSKLRVIGHGIDTDFYSPTEKQKISQQSDPVVIQVARLAPIKHQETTIQAITDTNIQLVLVGDVQAGSPLDYKHTLENMIKQLNINERVTFAGDLSPTQVRQSYRQATIAVNMSPVGLFDKAVLESMACGIPTIVCNPAFSHLMGDYQELLIVDSPKDVEGLHNRIQKLCAMSDVERHEIGNTLRRNVVQQYSLLMLIQRLVNVLNTGEIKP